jgi:hypothetical protein
MTDDPKLRYHRVALPHGAAATRHVEEGPSRGWAVTDDPKLRHDCVALPYERLPPDTSEAA